ncbi:unnamed protein product [Calypogeia fissa]
MRGRSESRSSKLWRLAVPKLSKSRSRRRKLRKSGLGRGS